MNINLKTRKPIKWGRIASYLVLIIFAVIYAGPLLILVNTSLKTMPEFMKGATSLATSINFDNFTEAWTKANFSRYLTNSLIYTVSSTVIYVITAIFVAYPVSRQYVKGANLILGLFVIALFLPPALIPQFQLMLPWGYITIPLATFCCLPSIQSVWLSW